VLVAGVFALNNSQSPEFSDRAIAALAADPEVLTLSGSVLATAALAALRRYGHRWTIAAPLTLPDA
jgi:hypothetical protein